MNDEQFDQRDREHHKEIQRLKNKHHFAIRKLQDDVLLLENDLSVAIEALLHYSKGNAFGKVAREALENIGL